MNEREKIMYAVALTFMTVMLISWVIGDHLMRLISAAGAFVFYHNYKPRLVRFIIRVTLIANIITAIILLLS